MAVVVGTVISVALNSDVKKQGGGTYKGWELVYKSQDGEVRSIAKPVTTLRFNRALEAGLRELEQGDVFTLVQEKGDNGFNEVKSVKKGADINPSLPATAPRTGGTGNAKGRDFESKEERTIKQQLIVRQSALSPAVDTLSVGSKGVNPDEVIKVAEKYYAWVFNSGQDYVAEVDDDIPV